MFSPRSRPHGCICWCTLTRLLFLRLFALLLCFLILFLLWGVVGLCVFAPRGQTGVGDLDLGAGLYVCVLGQSRFGLSDSNFTQIWFLLFVRRCSVFLLIDLFRLLCFLLLSGVFSGFSLALLTVAACRARAWTRPRVFCERQMERMDLR